MRSVPLLQVAFDGIAADEMLQVAGCVREYVDIFEIGTALLKQEGVKIITSFKTAYPEKLIFVDTKTLDLGRIEAQIVFQAGADFMSVCGIASDETIRFTIEEAHARQKKVLVDLIGIEDTFRQMKRFTALQPDYITIHAGVDERSKTNDLERVDLFEKVETVAQISPLPIAIAGGIQLDDLPYLIGFQPSILVIGQAIVAAPDPREKAKRFWQSLHSPFPTYL